MNCCPGGPGDRCGASLVSGDAVAGASSRPALQGGAVAFGYTGAWLQLPGPGLLKSIRVVIEHDLYAENVNKYNVAQRGAWGRLPELVL